MVIEVQSIIELIIVVTTIKLITSRYQPPIQESLQAIICIAIGTLLAMFVDPTPDGFVTGIVGSGLAFYGADLVKAFNGVRADIKDLDRDKE